VEITRLKGGSLSGTFLIRDNGRQYVRKTASLAENREYGFQRWYSQLKRIQRYNHLFPGLFPTLLDAGINDEGGYFDIEYYQSGINCHEYICSLTEDDDIHVVCDQIIRSMATMHAHTFVAPKNALELYIEEEVKAKLSWCLSDLVFQEFYGYDYIYLNGEKVVPLGKVLDQFIEYGLSNNNCPVESFTHGNITLENMLYVKKENRVIFIDPYDENFIDSKHNEYSQILQSSNSLYEIYNAGQPEINENRVNLKVEVPIGLIRFNTIFNQFLDNHCTDSERDLVRFFEISQFTRMLPFKMAIDRPKMFFFYALASKLFADTNR
jgi:hypothetical protein